MNTRAKGDKLEDKVVAEFATFDIRARKTANSGVTGQAGDVVTELFFIECKNLKGQSISVNSKIFDELTVKIPNGVNKMPMIVRGIDDGRMFCVVQLEDMIKLCKLLDKYSAYDDCEL